MKRLICFCGDITIIVMKLSVASHYLKLNKSYCSKKKEMVLDNEGFGPVNEQLLYHGTDASVVDAICRKGFDWRVCGKNGTLYGQGSCFFFHIDLSFLTREKTGVGILRLNT